MDYRSIKWIIFTVLFLTAPAMLFLIMAVMFMPAVFLVAGIVYLIAKMFASGHVTESLSFMVIFAIHTLVYAGLYYLVSVILAKTITLINSRFVKSCLTGAFCLGMFAVTRLPVYGGGGHGPIRWHPLAKLFDDFNQSYGAGTVEIVYGISVLLLCTILLIPKLRNKPRGDA